MEKLRGRYLAQDRCQLAQELSARVDLLDSCLACRLQARSVHVRTEGECRDAVLVRRGRDRTQVQSENAEIENDRYHLSRLEALQQLLLRFGEIDARAGALARFPQAYGDHESGTRATILTDMELEVTPRRQLAVATSASRMERTRDVASGPIDTP